MKQFVNMERNEILINVVGASASGKSSVMHMIQQTLIDKGLNVEMHYNCEGIFTEDQLTKREKAFIERNSKISINEVRAARNFR